MSREVCQYADGFASAKWHFNKEKTLIFVYYAGHGVMQNFTKVVCNKFKRPAQVFFPLEQNLRTLGTKPGTYVVGIFDCCRAEFVRPDRGAHDKMNDGSNDMEEAEEKRNCILTFGCRPNSSVSAVSTVANEFF